MKNHSRIAVTLFASALLAASVPFLAGCGDKPAATGTDQTPAATVSQPAGTAATTTSAPAGVSTSGRSYPTQPGEVSQAECFGDDLPTV